jgi:glucose-6-phosphate 1-dehydrogenase
LAEQPFHPTRNTGTKLLEGVQQFSRRKGEANGEWKTFSESILYFEKDLLDDKTYDEIIRGINDKGCRMER